MRNRLLRAALAVVVILTTLVVGSTQPASANPSWWDSNYSHRLGVTIMAVDALSSGYSVYVTFNHAAAVTAGNSLASGNDVRMAYWNGSTWSQLDRLVDPSSSWNSATTKIWFRTQGAISAASSNTAYYLYYGYPSAGAPPADGNNIFDLYDDFSGGSLNGTKWTAVTQGGSSTVVTGGEAKASGTVTSDGTSFTGFRTNSWVTSNFMLESSFAIASQSAQARSNWKAQLGFGEADVFVNSTSNTTKYVQYWNGSSDVTLATSGLSGQTFSSHRIGVALSSTGVLQYWEDGNQLASRTGISTGARQLRLTYDPEVIGVPEAFDVRYDDVWLRKFVANEPTTILQQSEDSTVSVTVDPSLVFSVAAHSGACNGAAQSGDASSSATAVSLGNINLGTTKIGAQDVTTSTNAANGFSVYARRNGALSDGLGHSIADLSGASNAAPIAFPAAGTAAFGYTTSDSALGTGTANRFTSGGPKWAPLTTSNEEVSFSATGTTSKTVCAAYQVGISTSTPAGSYSTTVVYTAIPVF